MRLGEIQVAQWSVKYVALLSAKWVGDETQVRSPDPLGSVYHLFAGGVE